MSDALRTAISGLNDSVLRISNAVSNIVNASSTGRLPENTGDQPTSFLPQDVITTSNDVGGVTSSLKPRDPAYVTAPDPKSPSANAEGLVAAPNVDIAAELMNTLVASATYRANAAVIKAVGEDNKKLLDTVV